MGPSTAHRLIAMTLSVSLGFVPACSTSPPPTNGETTGGTSTGAASATGAGGGLPSGGVGSNATGGWRSHTDCFQGCSRCIDGIYYYAPPHPAYEGDCCTAATPTVCPYGCDPEPYSGCLAPPPLGGAGGMSSDE
jgi:hypothetical protein